MKVVRSFLVTADAGPPGVGHKDLPDKKFLALKVELDVWKEEDRQHLLVLSVTL